MEVKMKGKFLNTKNVVIGLVSLTLSHFVTKYATWHA